MQRLPPASSQMIGATFNAGTLRYYTCHHTVVGHTVVGHTVVGHTVVGQTVVAHTVVGHTVVGDAFSVQVCGGDAGLLEKAAESYRVYKDCVGLFSGMRYSFVYISQMVYSMYVLQLRQLSFPDVRQHTTYTYGSGQTIIASQQTNYKDPVL